MATLHEVRKGDCISSIAFEYGFFPDTIWNHPQNAELKAKRQDPNVLFSGDRVFIPDIRIREEPRDTGQDHWFRRKGLPHLLKIQMRYFEEPWPGLTYTLQIDGEARTGTTDGDGWLIEPIPPTAEQATLILEDGTEYELQLGTLAPIDEIVGVQDRLRNLGYFDFPSNGTLDADTEAAIASFQASHDLEVSGEMDGATCSLLQELTGA